MKAICHILRTVGYMTLLPYLAYAQGESYATCLVTPGAVGLGLSLALVTFLCIIGYGNILHGKWRGPALLFWISNTAFYALFAALVLFRFDGTDFSLAVDSLVHFAGAFFPQYKPYSALLAVGGLTNFILVFWMPAAAILSLSATMITLHDGTNRSGSPGNTGTSERTAAPGGDGTPA